MRCKNWRARTSARVGALYLIVAAFCVSVGPARTEELQEPLRLSVGTGEVQDFAVELGDGDLPALRADLSRHSDLPDDLQVGFVTPETPQPERWPEAPLARATVVEPGDELYLRAMARRCSATGSFQASLRLRVADPLAGGSVELPVQIDVYPAGPCGGIFTKAASGSLSLLLVGLALFCVWSMWRRSRFLDPEALSRKVCPLAWQETGVPEPNRRGAEAARDRILHGMPWRRRLSVWMRSWWRRLRRRPWLAFGGGVTYEERVQVYLGSRHDEVVLQPVPEGDLAPSERGSLFAVACNPGGIRFLAAPGPDGRVEGMEMEPAPPVGGSELNLSRRTRLLNNDSFEEDPAGPAGWRIG